MTDRQTEWLLFSNHVSLVHSGTVRDAAAAQLELQSDQPPRPVNLRSFSTSTG